MNGLAGTDALLDWRHGLSLGSEEALRGIKVRNGALVLRPSDGMLAGTVADCLFLTAVLGLSIRAGGGWFVTAGGAALFLVDAVLRLRVSVVADHTHVRVRNRWRSRSFAFGDISYVAVREVRWLFRKPYYLGNGKWASTWAQGFIGGPNGPTGCDALVSVPDKRARTALDLPIPAEAKIDALRRWLEASRSADGTESIGTAT